MSFWIMFAVFGLIWIPCILLFALGGADAKHKITGSLICLGFWFLMSVGLWGQEMGNQERWNDGYCVCGQHWELKGVDKNRHGSETKYYSCPDCYREIEIIR